MSFTEKTFSIGALDGISEKSITEHLKLYAGYVKHSNLILDKITEMSSDADKNSYAIAEMQRRFGFEFDGMRNHEYYFEQFEGGATASSESDLSKKIVEQWGSFDTWIARFKAIGLTRGIGWAILYYDEVSKQLVNAWIDEQHLGQLTAGKVVLALDMWEHSYLFDYVPADKKNYIEAFFKNLNWKKVEERFVSYL